jgi:SAM-dependent methyltransferase
MAEDIRSAVDFYTQHPISADIVLKKLTAARGHLDGVTPDELFAHDQDHYGGLAANDVLAACASLAEGLKVADFCAGLGGPARYLAHRYGVDVTGVELTPARVEGARTLTRLVGLQDRVRVLQGDVMAAPLDDASVDVVVSQEAFLHVPDKSRALAEASRVLKPQGRLAFTDWVAHRPLTPPEQDLLWRGMAVTALYSPAAYGELVRGAGFDLTSVEDLTAAWGAILTERLAMYRKLRSEAEAAQAPAGHDAFYESYVLFVDLVNARDLGGARFAARKPARP